nr:tRNA lysidine(34) synthetase TilS [Corynebacterium lubricantis]
MRLRVAVRPFDGPAVIGLSGGADSLSLVAAAAAEGKNIDAVVVDHGLQEGSREVAENAAQQARDLGVTARVVAVNVAGENIEAAAREARYAALHNEAGDRDVWVAHTADDQAETLILGALRGNPAGMSVRSEKLVRPLLTTRRADTVAACEELGLKVWHDPMNHDPAYRRVRVRHEVIPLLSEILGGDATSPLATTANRIAEDNSYIEAHLETGLEATTDCATLAADPPALRTRKVARWLNDLGVGASQSSISDVLALCTNWHGQGPVYVGGGLQVRRIEGRLRATLEES